MDGWSDSEEYLLYGTDPLDALSFPLGDTPTSGGSTGMETTPVPEAAPPPPPSLSNGNFSDVGITTWKSMLFSKDYQGKGFVWNAGTVGSWTAYVKLSGFFMDLYDFSWPGGIVKVLGFTLDAGNATKTQAGHATLTTATHPDAGKVFYTRQKTV